MFTFNRSISVKQINDLKKEALFKNCLLPDIRTGEVFPALRDGYIDFYHGGGRLFTYNSKFETHIKYAAVADCKKKSPYISESELAQCLLPKDFSSAYGRIKENCKNYSGIEALGVASLYSKFSYASRSLKGDIAVLDIEVGFTPDQSKDENADTKKAHKIDILLYNKKTKCLLFVEAKHFSNPEIWGSNPKVVDQIARYKDSINKHATEIADAYAEYLRIMDNLLEAGGSIKNSIGSIAENVCLYVFGFDIYQHKHAIPVIKKVLDQHEVCSYTKGGEKSIEIKSLWDTCSKCTECVDQGDRSSK